MKKFFGTLVLVMVCAVALALIGCSQKKSEMPIGEIMANTTTNAASEQNAVAMVPAAVVPSEVTAPPVEVTTSGAPTLEEIQTALKNAGYYTGKVDGKIGPKSKKAIEAFQQDNGLKADGKVGSKTWGKLKAHLNKTTAPATTAAQPVAD